jgi:hypothetical protein
MLSPITESTGPSLGLLGKKTASDNPDSSQVKAYGGSDREKAQKLENEEVVKQQKRKDP